MFVVGAILSVVGFAFEGLLWLAMIGVMLFIGALVLGLIRQRTRARSYGFPSR